MNITILASGTWGTALARVLSAKNNVTVWSISQNEVDTLSATRRHPNLPGMVIPDSIVFTTDICASVTGADIIIVATPSNFVRTTVEKIKNVLIHGQIIVCVAKGIEEGTLFTMSEIIGDVLENSNPVVALSGPTHAEEVALDKPTLIVSSSADMQAAKNVQMLFAGTCIRPYTNGDIVGIELCGALKNVIALACGIATGLGYGDNTRAAIMTRGMAEIRALGRKMGCFEETFSGLAGMGDLIVTATSRHSRNNRAGQLIGHGLSPADAIKEVGMVVEGVNTLPAAVELSRKYGVEMPIINAVNNIVHNGLSARDAVMTLLNRSIKSELSKAESQLRYENELLNQKRKESDRRILVYGAFDCMDYIQIEFLNRAGNLGGYLVVALMTDGFAERENGAKPSLNYNRRKAVLDSLSVVNSVIPVDCYEQINRETVEHRIDAIAVRNGEKIGFASDAETVSV